MHLDPMIVIDNGGKQHIRFHSALAWCSKFAWSPLPWQRQASVNAVRADCILQPMPIAEGLTWLDSSGYGCASSLLTSKLPY